nr:MAG TPA: hypothetical protein [Caudoviricetes sp.]DAN57229.1 MAG TPA: hypothetical protein [Caudoviricetes sp.]
MIVLVSIVCFVLSNYFVIIESMETDNEITQKGVFAFLKYSFVIVCDFVATCVLLDYVYILPHVGRNVNRFLKVF